MAAATTKQVKIVNRGRDQITFELPVMEANGRPKRGADKRQIMESIHLGSRDDEGVDGAHQPEIVLDGAVWDRLTTQKGVAGMVADRLIDVYPVA